MRGWGKWVAFGLFVTLAYAAQPTEAERAERKAKGLHCLSGWNRQHDELVANVKANLRDPESFETISTRVSSRSVGGEHLIQMQYRARNGFGGMVVAHAAGMFRGSDCFLITWHQL